MDSEDGEDDEDECNDDDDDGDDDDDDDDDPTSLPGRQEPESDRGCDNVCFTKQRAAPSGARTTPTKEEDRRCKAVYTASPCASTAFHCLSVCVPAASPGLSSTGRLNTAEECQALLWNRNGGSFGPPLLARQDMMTQPKR